jgi:hypothetical protein
MEKQKDRYNGGGDPDERCDNSPKQKEAAPRFVLWLIHGDVRGAA